MKKLVLLISVWSIVFSSIAQEKVLELSETFRTSYLSQKESFAISNKSTNELVLLLKEKKLLYSYLLDSKYKISNQIYSRTVPSKYSKILGYNVNNKIYSIFYSNDRNSKFAVLRLDFTNNSSEIKILEDFKIKNEVYIESINYNNKIHLLTTTENTSDINIYLFDKDLNPTKRVVRLEKLEFPKIEVLNSQLTVSNLFAGIPLQYRISKIESRNPNIIETTSSQIKLYPLDNELTISFDISSKETTLCHINLDTFATKLKRYEIEQRGEEFDQSNSYVFDHKLFQISSSKIKLKFSILDLKTEQLIKEYLIEEKDSINFKNSPIFIEGSDISQLFRKDKFRTVEKTKKFLRNISLGNVGISAYKVDHAYDIVLGGTLFSHGSVALGGFGFGGTLGGGNFMSFNFNPTFYGYRGYNASTKTTYINCLFDANFNHSQGDIPLNKYDILNDFETTLPEKINAINIFIHNEILHFNYFDPKEKIFKLYKFEE
ncbi:hypothetical protein GCM10009430_10740 [Aquimarina litoralis]|uniref:Uncharacterized protein n=1 Tax=Aquimarina litoralis TaxID=584605 RepID=A0ABP3TT17_9FLAO